MKSLIKSNLLILFVLLVSAGFLRFYDLGYSNYTADEYGAMIWTKTTESNFPNDVKEFLLTRKKGPMQYLITYVPILMAGEFNNEIALRAPFALASTLAVLVFYLLILRLTESRLIAFISASLLMTSGFIAAFGRIAQYQNLNLLFSFTAALFYTELLVSKKGLVRKTLTGTFFLGLSLLSHWDVIYIIPPILLIVFAFVKNKEVPKKSKTTLLKYNLVLLGLITLPFLIPYFARFEQGGESRAYITRRFGYNRGSNVDAYAFDIEFYNPFITLALYAVGGFIGALFIKKSRFFVIWFLANFIFFEFFIRKPGTHIYNFLIPIFVLVAIALAQLIEKSFNHLKIGPILFVSAILAFLYYQTYLVYVDHSVSYPWRQEEILGHLTVKHSHEHRSRYLIGFPHNRYWEEVNEFILEQNELNNETYGYLSNESKTISEYYMDVKYKTSNGFYAIGIKDPWSFSSDYKFPQIKDKHTVRKFKNDAGQNVVQIFRVGPK